MCLYTSLYIYIFIYYKTLNDIHVGLVFKNTFE